MVMLRFTKPPKRRDFATAAIGALKSGAQRISSRPRVDRKSTRLNSSHRCISYAVFCLKKKKTNKIAATQDGKTTAIAPTPATKHTNAVAPPPTAHTKHRTSQSTLLAHDKTNREQQPSQ